MKILVTDADERSALAAVRSLGQQHSVFVIAKRVRSLAGASRFARESLAAACPTSTPDVFAADVRRIVRDKRIDVVLPVSDAASRALLGLAEALQPAVLAGPTRTAFERVSDKAAMADAARMQGLDVPEGREVRLLDEAIQTATVLGFPVVLKPVRSLATNGGRLAVVRVNDEVTLRRHWPEAVRAGSVLVQQHVPGRGEGVFLLRQRGVTRAVFAHRRLREKPPEGGTSVLRESIPPDPIVREAVEHILDEAGFEGVAMAEFRSDGARRWLMEINGRLWGSLQLAIDAGVDFPSLLVDSVTGESRAEGIERPPNDAIGSSIVTGRIGVRSRWELGDLDHAIALARGAHDAEGRSGLMAALGVLALPTGPGTRLEVLRRDDLRPFFREAGDWWRALRGRPKR